MTILNYVMNPKLNMSSHQGITSSLETEEESKGSGGTENPLEGMVGGRSVLLAAEGSALAIASEQDVGVAEEVAERTLSHRDTVQELAPSVSLIIAVDRDDSRQMQLPGELETCDKLKGLEAILEKESENENHQQKMLGLIEDARSLIDEHEDAFELGEARRMLDHVFEYIGYNDDILVASEFYAVKASLLCAEGDVDGALYYFGQLEELSADYINFSKRLVIINLMLGMDFVEENSVFRPDDFYKELKKLLVVDETEEGGIAQLLETEFGEDAAQVKIFHDGIKAVFEEDIGAEAVSVKFEHSVAELNKCEKDGTLCKLLNYSVPILKFGKNFRLVKEGYFDKALENIEKTESHLFECLDEYIRIRALVGIGNSRGFR